MFHMLIGIGLLVGGRSLGPRSFLVAGLAPVATVVWMLTERSNVAGGGVVTESFQWVGELGITVDLRLDGFAMLMVVLVSGVGALVCLYAWQYFHHSGTSVHRLAGVLELFSGSMLGLVLADNLLWLFICWELTSITSYLLIGHNDHDRKARAAALQALLITGMGGLVMLAGFLILGLEAGTFRISELVADPGSGTLITVSAVLVLIGAFTKSAQVPFHSWLPGAMVAATPTSAYLHSAAMVKAGVFLVMRLGPAYQDVDLWRHLGVSVGVATMLVGGLRALRQNDIKLLLAYGTVSQLGLLMVMAAAGETEAVIACGALLLAHAAFKAALFMVVGIVDHQVHTRDLRLLGGFGPSWRPTMVVAVLSAASMAGLPPLAGFIAKETALEALGHGAGFELFALIGVVVGSALTVAYSIRFVWGTFVRKPHAEGAINHAESASSPAVWFLVPAAVLAVATVLLGVWPGLYTDVVGPAADSVEPGADTDLYLWHGINQPLVLSAVAIVVGIVLFTWRRRVDAIQQALRMPLTAERSYDESVLALTRIADRVTGIAQPGSLPLYAGVVLFTAAALPSFALVRWGTWPGWPDLVDTPAHVAVAALIVIGSLAVTIAKRRFTAALLLGTVGYGMALLFVIQGAPDLALTQFTIETLTVVLFLLVLRYLPDRFEHRPLRASRLLRIAVSACVGVFVFVILIMASAARTGPSEVAREMSETSLEKAGGRNVVNVILVDFRGIDTMGEITVLVVAALGAVALARAVTLDDEPDAAEPDVDAEDTKASST